MGNMGSTRGSFKGIENKLHKEVDEFKQDIRDEIGKEVSRALNGMIIDAEVDDIKIDAHVNAPEIVSDISSQMKQATSKTKQKTKDDFDLSDLISFDDKKLTSTINKFYKEYENGVDKAQEKFLKAALVGKSRGLKLSDDQEWDINELKKSLGMAAEITARQIEEINQNIAKVDLSPMETEYNEAADTAKKTAQRITEANDTIEKGIRKLHGVNKKNIFDAKPEQLMLADDSTNYSIYAKNDVVAGIPKELYQDAIKTKKQNINSVLHTHPNDLTAAFSFDDIEQAIQHKADDIIHEYVLSINDVAVLDTSKFTSEQLQSIVDYMKKNLYTYLQEGLTPVIDDNVAFDKVIKDNIEQYINDAIDLYILSLNDAGVDFDGAALKSKLLDSVSKISVFDNYDDTYDILYEKFIDSVKSLDFDKAADKAENIADNSITLVLQKGLQEYTEKVFKEAINHAAPDINIDDVYKKTKLNDLFFHKYDSLLPGVTRQQILTQPPGMQEAQEAARYVEQANQSIATQTVQLTEEARNIQSLIEPLEKVVKAINEKTEAFKKEDTVVESVVSNEIGNLSRLSSTIEEIAGQIKSMDSIPISLDLDSNEFKQAIQDISEAVQGLNIKDSSFLTSIESILSKGQELENLAKIVSTSKKKIEEATQIKEDNKQKEIQASYQKELDLRKQRLALQHEINMAIAQEVDNADEIKAKNQPMINLLNQQIQAEKERKNTSREYRTEIEAEYRAIEKKYAAEEEGLRRVRELQNKKTSQAQAKTEAEAEITGYVKQLEGLRNKIKNTINLKEDKLVSGYVNQLEDQLKELNDAIDKINNKQIDVTDPEDKEELDQLVETSKKLQTNLEKAAKDVSIKSLDNRMADYLSKNTRLSKELRTEIEALRDRLKDPNLSGKDLAGIAASFEKAQAKAKDFGQEGKRAIDIISNRLTDMDSKFIAQFLSWQDLIRYIRETATEVIKVDTALTELRKVSDASTERLEQSFEKASQTAQELGSSISDVINISADWSRLGYSIGEAEDLARVTTLFQTVGDNMTAESASEAMISTLKGYSMGVDQAEHIVDQYNEVNLLVAPLYRNQIRIGCSCTGC